MKTVPRIGRLLDLGGLLLFLGGGATYFWAWSGFQNMTGYVPPLDVPALSAVSVANGYWRLEKIGMGLMMAGGAVFVLAWWVARAHARRAALSQRARR